MTLDERLQRAAHGVADRVEAPSVDIGAVRAGARDRARRTQTAVVAVVVVIVALAGVAIQLNRNAKSLEPVTPPPGSVPVWYDATGLHRGDVVEQTPVDVWDGEGGDLALVRTGALYRDQANNDVWFHPWGGEPRIVGRDSREGPGGDPNGDLAAWFEGQELVVYDTAKDLQVSRTDLCSGRGRRGGRWRPRPWRQPLPPSVGPGGGVVLRERRRAASRPGDRGGLGAVAEAERGLIPQESRTTSTTTSFCGVPRAGSKSPAADAKAGGRRTSRATPS